MVRMATSRLTSLPESILIIILSFLPTIDAVRTCKVSRAFAGLWKFVQIIDVCEDRDLKRFGNKRKYDRFLKTLLTRPLKQNVVTKMRISVVGDDRDQRGRFRTHQRVFDMVAGIQDFEYELLLRKVVYSITLQDLTRFSSLVSLKLSSMILHIPKGVILPLLRSLTLRNMAMDDRSLRHALQGSPNIEFLELVRCTGFILPQIISSSLVFLKFVTCGTETLRIAALNLLSLTVEGEGGHVVFAACSVLRRVSLERVTIRARLLCGPTMRTVRTLVLKDCSFQDRRVEIDIPGLQTLMLSSRSQVKLAGSVSSQELHTVRYEASSLDVLFNAPMLRSTSIQLSDKPGKKYDDHWYEGLLRFLESLRGSDVVVVHCTSKQAFVIPIGLRPRFGDPVLPNVSLEVTDGDPINFKNALSDSLKWITKGN